MSYYGDHPFHTNNENISLVTFIQENETSATFDNSYPRSELVSVDGRIPIIPVGNQSEHINSRALDSVQIPFTTRNIYKIKNNYSPDVIELFFCSVCFDYVEYAFEPQCSRNTCKGVWFCTPCLKKYFDPRTKYFLECTKCTRKMCSVFDNFSNKVNMPELFRRCNHISR